MPGSLYQREKKRKESKINITCIKKEKIQTQHKNKMKRKGKTHILKPSNIQLS